jgi:HEAT repeat protein
VLPVLLEGLRHSWKGFALEGLRHSEADVRRQAAEALGAMRAAAKPAVLSLLATTEDVDRYVRETARRVLLPIDPEVVRKGDG